MRASPSDVCGRPRSIELRSAEYPIWLIVAFQGAKQKSDSPKPSSERLVRDIRRATRKQYSAEEKIRIVLDGLRGEHSIAELCRREGIAESLYYSWSKEFLEAGKRRLTGDTARATTSDEVKDLRREARELKEVVAEQAHPPR
jgi:transposase